MAIAWANGTGHFFVAIKVCFCHYGKLENSHSLHHEEDLTAAFLVLLFVFVFTTHFHAKTGNVEISTS